LEWTSVGGTFSQQTYATPTDNNSKFARFIATTSGQYFETTARVIPSFLGAGCMADIRYFTATNQAFRIQALDVSANVLAEQILVSNSFIQKSPTITFPCPAVAATVRLRVSSLLAGTIDADDGYIGGNKGIINSSQAQVLGTLRISGCASSFSTTSTTLASFGTNTTCVYSATGKVLAPTTQVAGFRVSFVPKGRLSIRAIGHFAKSNTTTNTSTGFVIRDITNSVNGAENFASGATGSGMTFGYPSISGNIPSGSVTSNVNFEIFGRTTAAGSPAFIDSTIPLEFEVLHFPDEADTGVQTSDQSGWQVDVNIGGGNPLLSTAAVTSYTEITNATLDLVPRTGSASAQIACASGTASTGTTCSSAESVGIAFVPPFAGLFDVCADFTHGVSGAASNTSATTYQLVETTNTSSAVLQEGGQRTVTGSNTGSQTTNIAASVKTCGTFLFSSTSQKTIRLAYEQTVVGTANPSISADRDANSGQRDIRFTVRPSTMNVNRPVLTGEQVTTPGASKKINFKMRSTSLCTAGACAVENDSNVTLSAAFSSTGVYNATIPGGTCSATPYCTSGTIQFVSFSFRCQVAPQSSTLLQISCYNSAGSAVNEGFSLDCSCNRP
jgi:hypothetical protein